jgi:hypothetical protein
MNATHIDPRRILTTAMAALVLALIAAALVSAVGNLELSSAPAGNEATATTVRSGTPTWVENPMASPLAQLRATP